MNIGNWARTAAIAATAAVALSLPAVALAGPGRHVGDSGPRAESCDRPGEQPAEQPESGDRPAYEIPDASASRQRGGGGFDDEFEDGPDFDDGSELEDDDRDLGPAEAGDRPCRPRGRADDRCATRAGSRGANRSRRSRSRRSSSRRARSSHRRGRRGGRRGARCAPPTRADLRNRVWKLAGESDGFADGVLSMTVEDVLNPPRGRHGGPLEDADLRALVGSSARIYRRSGDTRTAATTEDLGAADRVEVHGKLLPRSKWKQDEDGEPTPTVRAKRVYILG